MDDQMRALEQHVAKLQRRQSGYMKRAYQAVEAAKVERTKTQAATRELARTVGEVRADEQEQKDSINARDVSVSGDRKRMLRSNMIGAAKVQEDIQEVEHGILGLAHRLQVLDESIRKLKADDEAAVEVPQYIRKKQVELKLKKLAVAIKNGKRRLELLEVAWHDVLAENRKQLTAIHTMRKERALKDLEYHRLGINMRKTRAAAVAAVDDVEDITFKHQELKAELEDMREEEAAQQQAFLEEKQELEREIAAIKNLPPPESHAIAKARAALPRAKSTRNLNWSVALGEANVRATEQQLKKEAERHNTLKKVFSSIEQRTGHTPAQVADIVIAHDEREFALLTAVNQLALQVATETQNLRQQANALEERRKLPSVQEQADLARAARTKEKLLEQHLQASAGFADRHGEATTLLGRWRSNIQTTLLEVHEQLELDKPHVDEHNVMELMAMLEHVLADCMTQLNESRKKAEEEAEGAAAASGRGKSRSPSKRRGGGGGLAGAGADAAVEWSRVRDFMKSGVHGTVPAVAPPKSPSARALVSPQKNVTNAVFTFLSRIGANVINRQRRRSRASLASTGDAFMDGVRGGGSAAVTDALFRADEPDDSLTTLYKREDGWGTETVLSVGDRPSALNEPNVDTELLAGLDDGLFDRPMQAAELRAQTVKHLRMRLQSVPAQD